MVQEWPTPKRLREPQGFLGTVGHYRQYIPSFATFCFAHYLLLHSFCIYWQEKERFRCKVTRRRKPLKSWKSNFFGFCTRPKELPIWASHTFWTMMQVYVEWELCHLKCKMIPNETSHSSVRPWHRRWETNVSPGRTYWPWSKPWNTSNFTFTEVSSYFGIHHAFFQHMCKKKLLI